MPVNKDTVSTQSQYVANVETYMDDKLTKSAHLGAVIEFTMYELRNAAHASVFLSAEMLYALKKKYEAAGWTVEILMYGRKKNPTYEGLRFS